MNIWILIAGIASLAVVLMCVAILFGRADWAVYEFKGDDREKFNPTRLRVATAVGYLLMALLVWVSHICDFSTLISIIAILLLAVLSGLIKGTWAMR